MFDLGNAQTGRVKSISVVTAGLREAQILASLQEVEAYWDTVFDEMPTVLKAVIANRPRLRRALQTNLQAASDYAALVRRQIASGNSAEAAKTLVQFQRATTSFHQSAQRWDARELGEWLLSEAVKDAYAGVVAVGEWISELPAAIRDVGRGAVTMGKWLIAGAVAVAVIVLARN